MHAIHRDPEFTYCVRTYLHARGLGSDREQTTGGVKLNGKIILAAVGAFALLGIGFSTLAGAAVPTHASTTTDTSVGEAADSGVSESNLTDSGLQSSHNFMGEEEGDF